MSPELDTKIREYGERLDHRATSLETLALRATSTTSPRTASRPRWLLATGAAALLVVAVGGVAVLTGLFSGGGGAPIAATPDDAGMTLQDGTWERTVLPAGLHVDGVEATSFGLVAADGGAGIWISEDAIEWQQVFAGPYEPFNGTTTTPAPPITAAPPAPVVGTSIQHVAAFNGALYAVGINAADIDGPTMTARLLVYRSDNGLAWEEIVIVDQNGYSVRRPTDLVPTDTGLLVYGEAETEGVVTGTVIFRSEDGRTWTELAPDQTGLGNVGLWNGVTQYSAGFIAIGEDTSSPEEDPTRAVYRSEDGLRWEPIPGTTFGRDDYSALHPDSFAEYGGVLFLGGFEFVWETGHQAALWLSTDGVMFERIELDPALPSMDVVTDLISTPSGLLVVGWSSPTETDPARLVLLTTTDGSAFAPVADEAAVFDKVQEQQSGIVFDDQVFLFGTEDLHDGTAEAYQWTWTPND